MEDNDVNLQQKKRARRRLIGAIFFVSVVALVLPMIMDQEPRQQVQDVEIRIPGQDDKPFAPRLAESPAEAPASPQADGAKEEKAAPPQQALAAEAAKPAAPIVPTVKLSEPVGGQMAVEKSMAEKSSEKPQEKSPEKPAQKADKSPASEKKPQEKKKDEKLTVKVIDKAEKSSEKPRADDAKRAANILSGQADEAKPAAKGEYLIQIGSFSDEGNVKALKSKLGDLGVKTFTEQLVTDSGKKIRVRAGPFSSREAADKALAKMKGAGVSGVIAAKP